MNSKRNLIILIVALVVVIAAAAVAYAALAPTVETQTLQSQGDAAASDSADRNGQDADGNANSADESTPAPDFAMTTVDGEEVALASLEGKPLVLNFWASTCGPCKSEMPEFQSAYEQYGDQVQFVMVNIPDFNGETRDRALQLIQQQGYTFPVYFDDNAEAQMQYGVTSIPQTYFINPDGTIAAYATGAIDESTLQRGLAMIL